MKNLLILNNPSWTTTLQGYQEQLNKRFDCTLNLSL